MSGPDWCRWYPSKWLGGVLHLTNEQRGVYIQVINVILDRGECSADPRYLGRLCNCRSHCASRIVGELIALGKLVQSGAKLLQNRAETERKLAQNLSENGRFRASKRWKNNDLADAPLHMQTTTTKKDIGYESGTNSETLNPPSEPHTNNSSDRPNGAAKPDLSAGFDSWWSLWTIPGTKRGKGTAQRAWKTARKSTSAEILAQHLNAHIRRWRTEGTDLHYIPHPASWLNGKRWEDDLFAQATRSEAKTDFGKYGI